jgi:hypothetical protein
MNIKNNDKSESSRDQLRTTDYRLPTKRYISLYSFFAFDYPENWSNEIDAAGNYVFYDSNGGSGVLRIMTQNIENKTEDAAADYLKNVLIEQKDYDAAEIQAGKNKFIRFVQIHDVGETEYTVYCYVTAAEDKIVLFTFTVQSAMKQMPVAEKEKSQLLQLLSTFEFIPVDHHDHDH